MPYSKERRLYLKLLSELESLTKRVEKINDRIHALLDAIDENNAKQIKRLHDKWMED